MTARSFTSFEMAESLGRYVLREQAHDKRDDTEQ